jgi:50S ribosomal protein L16 3-hydroxylase
MIRTWLSGTPLETFLGTHFQREPFVQPSAAAASVGLLGWETVARLLESRPDVIVVRNARPLPDHPALDAPAAMALFAEGYSLVIRGCEGRDVGLRGLADSIGREIEGDVAVQAFATPGGFQSFGWHYDCEDVFILQTCGVKDYQLRRNTVNPSPTIDAMPRDMQFHRETSPVIACTLIAGDWLYIPWGWWHVARAIEDSLSLSIGVLSPAARGARPPRRRAWERGA